MRPDSEEGALLRLGTALGKARRNRGATLEEVGEAIDLTPEELRRIEGGFARPRLKTLVALLVWLEVPPRRLQAEIVQADPTTAELLKSANEFYALYKAIAGHP